MDKKVRTTLFHPLLVRIGYEIAMWYRAREFPKKEPMLAYTDQEFRCEIKSSKRWILKWGYEQRKNGEYYEFFSIHKRVRGKQYGDKYAWYFEKYELTQYGLYQTGPNTCPYYLLKYGHYPYYWE